MTDAEIIAWLFGRDAARLNPELRALPVCDYTKAMAYLTDDQGRAVLRLGGATFAYWVGRGFDEYRSEQPSER